MSKKLKKFLSKLLKNLSLDCQVAEIKLAISLLRDKLIESISNDELRNFLLFDLTESEFNLLLSCLQLKSFKNSKEEVHNLIDFEYKEESQANSKPDLFTDLINKSKSQGDNQPTSESKANLEELNNYQDTIEEDDSDDVDNELEFTSDFSFYNYSSYDDSDSETNKKNSSNSIKSKLDQDLKLKLKAVVSLEQIDLKQFKADDLTSPSANTESDLTAYYCHETNCLLTSSAAKLKYDEKCKSRKSPDPSNISKLNLFKNIFDDETQSHLFNNKTLSSNTTEKTYNTRSSRRHSQPNFPTRSNSSNINKFYKLNDLVSVMLNEDYFKNKQEPNVPLPEPVQEPVPVEVITPPSSIEELKKPKRALSNNNHYENEINFTNYENQFDFDDYDDYINDKTFRGRSKLLTSTPDLRRSKRMRKSIF